MLRIAIVLLCTLAVLGCRKVTVNPDPLVRLCKQWGGAPLVVPDSRYQPGAILDMSKKVPAHADDLSICGVPYVTRDGISLPGKDPESNQDLIQDGGQIAFKWDETLEYGGKVAAKFPGVSGVGASFEDVHKTILDAQGLFGRGLRRAYAAALIEEGLSDDRCKRFVSNPAYRVIGEVLVAASTKASFQKSNGAKLDVSEANVAEYLKLDAALSRVDSATGSVEFTAQFPFCVKVLKKGTLVTGVLGPGEEQSPFDSAAHDAMSKKFAAAFESE